MREELIAACGMNCAICRAYLREKDPCHGCSSAGLNKPKTRVNCKIRNCKERKGKYCYDCEKFPCNRLVHIDERYRERYEMSEIENLINIRDKGINRFLKTEERRWVSKSGVYCVHDKKSYKL